MLDLRGPSSKQVLLLRVLWLPLVRCSQTAAKHCSQLEVLIRLRVSHLQHLPLLHPQEPQASHPQQLSLQPPTP